MVGEKPNADAIWLTSFLVGIISPLSILTQRQYGMLERTDNAFSGISFICLNIKILCPIGDLLQIPSSALRISCILISRINPTAIPQKIYVAVRFIAQKNNV
jgi:hypothetical protein